MNISALNPYSYSTNISQNTTNIAKSKETDETYVQQTDNGFSNSDGDTVELSNQSEIKAFLDKVKDGTVTETDLKNMQDKLKSVSSIQEAPGNRDVSELSSFLDKVKNGTVTESDLSEITIKRPNQ